jgi:hypothetical protein
MPSFVPSLVTSDLSGAPSEENDDGRGDSILRPTPNSDSATPIDFAADKDQRHSHCTE